MKRFIITIITAALALLSCTKEPVPSGSDPKAGTATLAFTLDDGSTRATGVSASAEAAVSSCQLFVFDAAGNKEAYLGPEMFDYSTLNSSSVTVTLGQKTVWAVCNAPSLSSVGTLDALKASMSYLKDNSVGTFVMSGSATPTVSANCEVALIVKRYVAKIILSRIRRQFSDASLTGASLVIGDIYVSNATGQINYGGTSGITAGDLWYNRLGVHTASDVETLVSDTGVNQSLGQGASVTTGHVFYVYPNASTDVLSGSWSPRHTRLVLTATIAGTTTCYYVVTLPVIERNRTYTITELTLTRAGSSDPDNPGGETSVTAGCSFSISVGGWEEGMSRTESF